MQFKVFHIILIPSKLCKFSFRTSTDTPNAQAFSKPNNNNNNNNSSSKAHPPIFQNLANKAREAT
ncbi:MAG: hypothetical protein JO297_16960 [Nitrososphaeraceae archaeon]|nr:hypothetical protein [Nitrososphaeraceae archaeon]